MSSKVSTPEIEHDYPREGLVPLFLLLGLFWSIFHWGFWERGFLALGINASVFLLLFFYALDKSLGKRVLFCAADWRWTAPVLLVVLSYTIFENPFLKACNILFLPAACSLLLLRAIRPTPEKLFSSPLRVLGIIVRGWLGPLAKIVNAITLHLRFIPILVGRLAPCRTPHMKSVLRGVLLLGLLSILVVIPLLASADAVFAQRFELLYEYLEDFFEFLLKEELFLRFLCFLGISLLALAASLAWLVDSAPELSDEQKPRDSITGAIVLGGILALYAFFLWIQFERLFLGTLPTSFQQTEAYVKSGFWQLVMLSALNIVLVFNYFRRSTSSLQGLLVVYILASLFLLLSAAHRMYLYVTLYGLSYEKFYASYTVAYCMLVFALILTAFWRKGSANVLQTAVILLLWMYGVVSVFPAEQVIARSNLALSAGPQSRIHLGELKMLSPDALPYIRARQRAFQTGSVQTTNWDTVESWINEQEKALKHRRWYEHTARSLIALKP